jgi:hypothetical protein
MGRGKIIVNDGGHRLGAWHATKTWISGHLAQLVTGLGVAAAFPEAADAARKNARAKAKDERQDEKSGKNEDEESRKSRQQAEESEPEDDESDKKRDKTDKNDAEAESEGKRAKKSESEASEDESDRGEKRQRNKSDDAEDEDNSGGGRRQATKRQDAEDSESEDDNGGGGRRSRDLEQNGGRNRDDEPVDDEPIEDVDEPVAPPATVPATNPNVSIGDIPDDDDLELVVQGGTDVIAGVSTSGGFAFARSGDVTAISGPDGAQIVLNGDIDEILEPIPEVEEPTEDGGNNDLGFTS